MFQKNVIFPSRSNFKLYKVFIEWGFRLNFLFVERQGIVNYWDLPSKISRNWHKSLVPKIARPDCWETFVNKSSQPTGLFCRFCCNESACSPFPANTTLFSSQSLSSYTHCSCFEINSTTNNLCSFWHIKFQQVGTYAFCSWDDIFTQFSQ